MLMFNVPQFLLLQDPKEMAGKKKERCSWIRENDGKLHCPIFHRRRIDSADILCDFSLTGSAKLWHIFYWVVQKAWIAVFQMDLEVSFYKKFQKISLKRADVDLNGWGAWKRCWTPSSDWMRTKGRQIGSRRQTLPYFSRLWSELCLQ